MELGGLAVHGVKENRAREDSFYSSWCSVHRGGLQWLEDGIQQGWTGHARQIVVCGRNMRQKELKIEYQRDRERYRDLRGRNRGVETQEVRGAC